MAHRKVAGRDRALGARADVLVFDASLPHDEVETLFAVRDGGTLWIMLDLNLRMAM